MDTQCIYYLKPMIDAGTLGTKGNTQVLKYYSKKQLTLAD